MGIYERDYVRREPPTPGNYGRGGWQGMKMWSANTWIIVLCVAVFAVDSLLPTRIVPMAIHPTIENFHQIDQSALQARDAIKQIQVDGRAAFGRDLYIKQPQGEITVAVQEVAPMQPLQSWLHFSTQRGFLQVEFWRLVGFQFLHANLMHLLFNMMGLYFFGPIVERYLGSKRYIAFYLLCGICGALMYVLLNLGGITATMFLHEGVQIPGLLFNSPYTPLIGASAGVFGVLMAGAYLAPKVEVLLFFILPMKLRTLAFALVAIALFTLITGGQNAGGEAGHLGGAIAGFYLIRRPHHLHGFFDVLGWVDPTSHHYSNRRKARAKPGRLDHVDAILDKVSREGVQSLTAREKKILSKASKNE